ncbi:uncharacterized protein VNE69_02125 [Vairimorpha necatrix]|uniref:Uncharacterized protein n=1 Tax=Vairimorpha necatrix TaxID=6039 RepID=A0AAX4J9J0_9MICR
MEERVNNLLKSGYFKDCNIDEKGFGTFTSPNKSTQSLSNDFLIKARTLKREGDMENKDNKPEAIENYIQSIIFYIKGYREEEMRIGKSQSVGYYKSLYKYTRDIYKMVKNGTDQKIFVHKILVAVKFHHLSLETKGNETEMSKNINELYNLCQELENFPKIDNIEDLYQNLSNN